MDRNKRLHLLVLSSLLAALSVVLTRFFSASIPVGGFPSLRIGLGPIPVILAGFIGGPVAGAAVGTVADLTGYMVNPFGGAFVPAITLIQALTGALPVLIYRAIGGGRSKRGDLKGYFVSIGLAQIILRAIAMPFILAPLTGWPVLSHMIIGLATQGLMVPVYSAAIHFLLRGESLPIAQGTLNAARPGR